MDLGLNINPFDLSQSVWLLLKVPVLLVFLLYMVFALVVVKQVNKMTETLEVGFEKEIKFIAYFHFLLALVTFVVALVIL